MTRKKREKSALITTWGVATLLCLLLWVIILSVGCSASPAVIKEKVTVRAANGAVTQQYIVVGGTVVKKKVAVRDIATFESLYVGQNVDIRFIK